MDRERWLSMLERLGCPNLSGRFDQVLAAYSEPHRAYHDSRHVRECLALLDEMRDACERPDEVELAIWLHDVVYRPARSDNEWKSAEVAADWLGECGAEAPVVARIRNLILATRHTAEPSTRDEEVLVDIDLHILGADPERFDEYEAQVREEYRWVPGPLYRRRRASILRGFQAREPLYRTALCRDRFEEQARSNLRRSIEALA